MENLEQGSWHGNVRELERAVERAAILSRDGQIRIADFEFEEPYKKIGPSEPSIQFVSFTNSKPIREMEREIILGALEAHHGNRTHTAKALGMSLRTLRHKLKQYREDGTLNEGPREIKLGKNEPVAPLHALYEPTSGASKPG